MIKTLLALLKTGKGITTVAGTAGTVILVNALWDKTITIPLNALILPVGATVGVGLFILKLTRR